MSLNNLPAGDKFRREVRTEWGGINLNESAGDGELIEALNMSSRVGKIPWRRKWVPTPVFLFGQFHGQIGRAHV